MFAANAQLEIENQKNTSPPPCRKKNNSMDSVNGAQRVMNLVIFVVNRWCKTIKQQGQIIE